MSKMFGACDEFNQPLNDWNVSNVRDMHRMFGNAKSFNQNIDTWHVASVEMSDRSFIMFADSGMEKLPKWIFK